ncbi:sacsin N-terminal ATP-binding-like domain-containing protein [Actinoallomurus sp. CA-150999]|uniref:sacsin N-terminal ATP-binding-like domain-containing protein n=1 Tax=Actinoallomurus sp. CA-150999 TaxID=3239887 RepID=UPI003D89CE54
MDDPFGTAAIRARVLDAWAASPARFREDANAEEDLARGGYRDRVIVELAQNAADAAARAGVPGRIRFILRDGVLSAANVGAPLDAAGVEALSTLRASAKRDEAHAVGRFGVGFAAVVAVSDDPSIVSGGAAVAWSAERTREAVARILGAAAELDRRGGHVPVLRLPFAAPATPLPETASAASAPEAASAGLAPEAAPAGPVPGAASAESDQEAASAGSVPEAAPAGSVSEVVSAGPSPVVASAGSIPEVASAGSAPEAAPAAVPEGYDSLVRLPLRDADAETLVRRLLAETGPALLLSLPALAEIAIEVDGEVRTLHATWDPPAEGAATGSVTVNGTTWRTAEAHGEVAADLLADRPVEERPYWQVRWAVADEPLPDDVPAVIHAPTPSDEPLGLPALLIASFPLAPDRRHVAPGPLTDFLIERAAEAYTALLPPDPRLLDLVPGPVAKGELDARLRRAILTRLPDLPLLPTIPETRGPDLGEHVPEADPARSENESDIAWTDVETPWSDEPVRVRGRDAVVVDGPAALTDVLAEVVPGLLPVGWPARHPALAALGVRRLSVADVADVLAGLDREPAWWRRLYAALDGADRDALAGLPVPLADGRTVRGPRGLLVTDPEGLDALGLRVVHPEAAHSLLLRLGAVEAGPRAVLTDAATRGAVAASYDEEDPEPIWHAVLTLVARAHLRPGEEPWLAELALPGDDGEPYPAGELLLPGAPLALAEVMADDAPFGVVDADLVERYGAEVLEAAGVLRTFALVRSEDVIEPEFHLDGEEEWAESFDAGYVIPEFTAVRDLEFVADWREALRLLAEPDLRAAVVEPVRVVLADGRHVDVPSYTAWWLRRHPVLDGHRPESLCVGEDLADLYDAAPADLDPRFAVALGVRTTVDALLAEPDGPAELLDRLADPARTVSRERLRDLWAALARTDLNVEPPDHVRALVDGEPEVVPAEDAIVVDRPDLLPLLRGQPLLFVPPHVADALELSLGGEEVPGVVASAGEERPVPAVARAVLAEAPETYVHHERLVVDGQEVAWWYADGTVHASGPAGLARGLAWACDRWPDRLLAEAALRDPEHLPDLLAEDDLGASSAS